MAQILGRQTINNVYIIQVDANPSTGSGTPAPVGSIALVDSGVFYEKTGTADTAWIIADGSGKANLAGGNNFTGNQTIIGQLSVGTATPNAASVLQIDSTTQGFLPPRMTSAQREAILTPPTGMLVFDTDINAYTYFDGTVWVFDIYRVCTTNQATTSTTYTDVTQLTTSILPVGRYSFDFIGTGQSGSILNGIGVRLSGATVNLVVAAWNFSQGANGLSQTFTYSQLSATTNVTSTGVLASTTDFPINGTGVFSLSSAGAVAVQIRTQNAGTSASVRINSSLHIRRLSG